MTLRFGVGCKFTDDATKYVRNLDGTSGTHGERRWPEGKVFQAAKIVGDDMGGFSILDTEKNWHYNPFTCTVVEEAPPGYALRLEVKTAVDSLVRRYGVAAVREALNRHDT